MLAVERAHEFGEFGDDDSDIAVFGRAVDICLGPTRWEHECSISVLRSWLKRLGPRVFTQSQYKDLLKIAAKLLIDFRGIRGPDEEALLHRDALTWMHTGGWESVDTNFSADIYGKVLRLESDEQALLAAIAGVLRVVDATTPENTRDVILIQLDLLRDPRASTASVLLAAEGAFQKLKHLGATPTFPEPPVPLPPPPGPSPVVKLPVPLPAPRPYVAPSKLPAVLLTTGALVVTGLAIFFAWRVRREPVYELARSLSTDEVRRRDMREQELGRRTKQRAKRTSQT